jgi:hypothetical protein
MRDLLRDALVRRRFADLETKGFVRVKVLQDESATTEELEGDSFNPEVNPDIAAERLAEERQQFGERIEREGVFGIVSEVLIGGEWKHAGSCWGFVGEDYKHSGHDVDIRDEAIDLYDSLDKCTQCGAVQKEKS